MRSRHRQPRNATRVSSAASSTSAVGAPLLLVAVLTVLAACSATTSAPSRPTGTTVLFVSLASADRGSVKAAANAVVEASVVRQDRLIVRLVTETASTAKAIAFGPTAGGGVFRSAARNRAARRREQADFVAAARRAVDDAIDAMPAADDVGDDLNELVGEALTTAGTIGGEGAMRIVVVSTGVQHTRSASVVAPGETTHPTLTLPTLTSPMLTSPTSGTTRSMPAVFLIGIGAFHGIADNVDPAFVRRVRAFAEELCARVAPTACRVVSTLDPVAIATVLREQGS